MEFHLPPTGKTSSPHPYIQPALDAGGACLPPGRRDRRASGHRRRGPEGTDGRIRTSNEDAFSPRAILRGQRAHPRRPMKASPNIPSRTHAVSRTPALELGGFSREPMKRAAALVPGSSSPLRRLSVAISLGIAAEHRSAVLARSDPGIPSGISMKRVAVKRRANRGFDSHELHLTSFSP